VLTLCIYNLNCFISEKAKVRRTPTINYGQSQIAFSANMSSHAQGLGFRQVVPFNTVRLNAGNAFDPITHVFICPVDGVYVFQSALMAYPHDMVQTSIVLDGTEGANIYAAGANSGHGYDQGFNSLVTLCQRGQHVWVEIINQAAHQVLATFTSFSGFLLFEVEAQSSSHIIG